MVAEFRLPLPRCTAPATEPSTAVTWHFLWSLSFLSLFSLSCSISLPATSSEFAGEVLVPAALEQRDVNPMVDEFVAKSGQLLQQKNWQGAMVLQLAALDLAPEDPSLLKGIIANVAKQFPSLGVDLLRRVRRRHGVSKAAVKAAQDDVVKILGPKAFKRQKQTEARLEKELRLPQLPKPKVTVPFAPVVLEFESLEEQEAATAPTPGASALPSRRERTEMADGVLQVFQALAQEKETKDGRKLNNLFYNHQKQAEQKTGRNLLSQFPAFAKIENAMRSAAVELLRVTGMSDAEIGQRVKGNLFIFASVHGRDSSHGAHAHFGDTVSGVYYLQAPPGSGRLVFHDPRGANYLSQDQWTRNAPFHRPFAAEVRDGKLLAWPGWLAHAVEQNGVEEGQYRISVTFDLEGDWLDTSATALRLDDGVGRREEGCSRADHQAEL